MKKAKAGMKIAIFAVVLVVLLASTLSLAFSVQPITAPSAIHIRSDGLIDPPTANITTANNVTYAFTDSINVSIVIERSNIVVDGGGYMIQDGGTGGAFDQWSLKVGVGLFGMNNVTIKNTNVMGFNIGIDLQDSFNCSVSGNNVTANEPIGICITDSSNCTVLGNNIVGNSQEGIYLGVPVQSYSIPPSNFNVICGNNITGNYRGIHLGVCSNFNGVFGNTIMNNRWGIESSDSFSNNILGNSIASNYRGIEFSVSFGNTISGNNVTTNIEYGVLLEGASAFNVISENNITNSSYGVSLDNSDFNQIFGNNLANHKEGLRLLSCSRNLLYHNNFINNTENTDILDSANVWDSGYPVGGNYWSGRSTPDEDMDKIGDRPYMIDTNNTDRYPLIYPYGFLPTPDIDRNGAVDKDDVATVARAFSSRPGDLEWNPRADIDTNEVINIFDAANVAKQCS
jgi:parallel beta-helix repeat protein